MTISGSQKNPYLFNLRNIQTFVIDVDGVLTDGTLIVLNNATGNGENWIRKMSVKDGYALQHASKMQYNLIVISGSVSGAIESRLRILGLQHLFFGIKDKKNFLLDFFEKHSLSFDAALYMGDDIPDIEAMALCKIAACPSDASEEALAVADYISPFKGGEGCVRDVISKVMKMQGKWRNITSIPST